MLRDAAFQFYYEENLEALKSGGARLVMIDALHSRELPPEIDGLYIGGVVFPKPAPSSWPTTLRSVSRSATALTAVCRSMPSAAASFFSVARLSLRAASIHGRGFSGDLHPGR